MKNHVCKFIDPVGTTTMSAEPAVNPLVRHVRNAIKNFFRFLPRPERSGQTGGMKFLRLASVLSAAMLAGSFARGADESSAGATTNLTQGGREETTSSVQASDVVRKLNAGNRRMQAGSPRQAGWQGLSPGQQARSGRVRSVDAFVVTSVELAPLVPKIVDAEPGAIVTETVDLENITEADVRRIVEKFLATNTTLFVVLVHPTPELEARYGGSKSRIDAALDRIATNAKKRFLDLSPELNDRIRNGTLSMITGTYDRASLKLVLLRMPDIGQTWGSSYQLPHPENMIRVSPSS
ncbi:hypothetical protein OPIT5_29545 [Opitutaceae bacterium TAV5]|nr:hypothetical protein OPIT5_29545 [Opitutaceae bacterium TAV5]